MHSTTVTHGPAVTMSRKAEEQSHSPRIMRQTQALMGLVLITGTLCAYLLGPDWLIIPAFIGCGLMFAGMSGLCPMASLIARMPWNRDVGSESRGSCCGGRCEKP